ncbi:MAG: SPW repeat protein [Burkholderiales bacterium]|nr:SPW repeat protein [Burkholderiales bacterium]
MSDSAPNYLPMRWREWLVGCAGIWLMLSPKVLDFATVRYAAANAYAVGAVLIGFCLMTAWRLVDRGEDIGNIVIGLWLAVCAYPLGFTHLHLVFASTTLTGVAVIVLAVWQMAAKRG